MSLRETRGMILPSDSSQRQFRRIATIFTEKGFNFTGGTIWTAKRNTGTGYSSAFFKGEKGEPFGYGKRAGIRERKAAEKVAGFSDAGGDGGG